MNSPELVVTAKPSRIRQAKSSGATAPMYCTPKPVADPSSKCWIEYHRCMNERVPVQFFRFDPLLNTWTDVRAFPTNDGIAVFEREQADFEQQLVGIVSHDLRNPLSTIHLATTLLTQSGGQDPSTLKTLGRITSSTERAMRLVRDLLNFTQARLGGGIPVQPVTTDLHALTRQVLEDVEAQFPKRKIELVTLGDRHGSCDPDRLGQVLVNLASNACKYSPAETPVRVQIAGDAETVTLDAYNQGQPIPRSMLDSIFEPMQRGLSESANATRSVGLGLYIVRHIVAAHGGSVRVRSDAAHGTQFSVVLPRFSA